MEIYCVLFELRYVTTYTHIHSNAVFQNWFIRGKSIKISVTAYTIFFKLWCLQGTYMPDRQQVSGGSTGEFLCLKSNGRFIIIFLFQVWTSFIPQGPPSFCYSVPGVHSPGIKYVGPEGFRNFSQPCMCTVWL